MIMLEILGTKEAQEEDEEEQVLMRERKNTVIQLIEKST